MSKTNGGKLEVTVKIDGMKESMDELLSFCREMADKEAIRQQMRDEKEDLEDQKEKWEDEKEIVKKEFDRIGELLKKAKPGTPEYHSLTEELYNLKRLIGYGW